MVTIHHCKCGIKWQIVMTAKEATGGPHQTADAFHGILRRLPTWIAVSLFLSMDGIAPGREEKEILSWQRRR
jgi:hypothetical protein